MATSECTQEHIWTPAGTDITIRWRLKYGWVPPSELAEYRSKWQYYQELPLRKLDDEARAQFEETMRKNNVKRWKVA